MVPLKPVILPSIAILPSTDPCFVQAIDDVALLASGLIASVDAAMLAIAVPSDRWNGELPIVTWDQRLAGCPAMSRTLAETPMYAAAFDALCLAADTLFARLDAWRWTDAEAPGLCLVTDGVGVMLSIDRPPAAADSGWLLDLVRSDGTAIAVRPLESAGLWSLIAAQSGAFH